MLVLDSDVVFLLSSTADSQVVSEYRFMTLSRVEL